MIDEHQLDGAIFDTVANLIVVVDRQGRLVKFNRACERLTGRSRQEVVGRFLWDFALPPEEIARAKSVFARMSAEGVPSDYQNEWLTPKGRRAIAWSSTGLVDDNGQIQFVVGTGRDVTARIEAERLLRDSERRFRNIVETAQEGVWTIDADARTTYVNRRMEQMLGYGPGEMDGRPIYDFMEPEHRVQAEARMEDRRRGTRYVHEFPLAAKDGKRVWVLVSASPLQDETGSVVGTLGMFADITALKDAQAAARDAERRLEFALSAANMVAWEWEPVSGRNFHRGSSDLLGSPQWPEEFFHVIHPEDAPTIKEMIERLLARPGQFAAEYRIQRPDGQVRWVRDRGVMEAKSDGTPVRMAGVSFDVTERRAAEETLRESEERFRLLVHNSPDLMFYQDLELRFIWVSKAIPPFTPENMHGLTDVDVIPLDQLEAHLAAKRRVLGTGIGERIGTSMTIGGRLYHFDTALEPRRDAGGTIIGIAGYTRDVTEQRNAETELQKLNATLEQRVADRTAELERQTRLLELVLENMGDGVAVADVSGRFLLFNAAISRMLGRTPGEVIADQWPRYFGFFEPDGVTPFPFEQLPLRRAIRGESVDDAELMIRRDHESEAGWVSITARPVRNSRGELIGGVSVMRDLSERKAAEQALRLSETRLRLLVEQAPVSIQTFWPDGRVRRVNRAWEQLFGVTPADIPGYNILADPQLVERGIMPLIQRAFAGETLAIPPIPYVPDRGPFVGRQLWTRAHIYPVMDERRQIYEVVLIHEDISEQKRTEDELREGERHYRELSEHNRRLVQEVEHRVRNNLAALLGLISVMRAEATDVQSFADAIEARIGGMAHVHQMLATGGWQPVELRWLIESMLRAMQHGTSERVSQIIEGPDVVVSPRRVLPLAMIIVEWFTNSCKYGAHSTPEGRLTVGWSVLPGGVVRLAWKERGGPPVAEPRSASLGTELVNAFATRELSGHCSRRFDADGVCHLLEFLPDSPATRILAGSEIPR